MVGLLLERSIFGKWTFLIRKINRNNIMTQFHPFQLGQLNCISLSDMSGEWHLPDLFGRVPVPELEKLLDQVGLDLTWPRQGTALLVDTGTHKVLIDSGLPSARGGQLVESLAAAGITPDQIDALFVTHGDGDHIGGLDNYLDADIYLPVESHRLWTEDEDGMVDEFIKLFRKKRSEEELAGMEKGRRVYPNRLREMGDRLKLVEPEQEFLPGFRFFPAPGHRRDHVILEIRSGDDLLLHVADGSDGIRSKGCAPAFHPSLILIRICWPPPPRHCWRELPTPTPLSLGPIFRFPAWQKLNEMVIFIAGRPLRSSGQYASRH